MTFNIMAK